ncbi:MAG: DUF4625 domain-containing protein [Salinivirgaceae bacterium]|nr:DUF4625 domain-containing protein [Salinivirgaceae bacterium]
MKNSKIMAISLMAILVVGSSCKKDDVDNTPPVVILGEPANEDSLTIGEEVHFECDFSDDAELKSYKVDIHFNDGHTHNKSAETFGEEGHPWTLEQSWDFEAGLKNSHIHHHEIVVPDSVVGELGVLEPVLRGEYHFGVYCTDVAGNESHVYIDVIL